jgi:hypothetical protein
VARYIFALGVSIAALAGDGASALRLVKMATARAIFVHVRR